MAAHCAGDHTPDRQLVPFKDVPCRVLGVFRKEHHLFTTPAEALADGLIVQQVYDHMPVCRLDGAVHCGLRMSQQMLRNRWDEAREKAALKAGADGDSALAVLIRQFQFKDIRPKAASEIELTHASRLLGHSTEEMTKKVYRRVGEIVKPTK